jgi:tRNA U34 2-thiouridine synthase MnmA/TrmU
VCPPAKKKIQALGLSSGGLDSILSALLLGRQGVAVQWVSFETPFFSADKARRAAEQSGIPLTVQNITPAYLQMLRNPRCGYGQHMNPCMDCHALMFRCAGELMQRRGLDFLFSGEVLGQRPMSQTRPSLRYVEKHSGFAGLILRPLSAKKLPPTLPEQRGWVNREQLLQIAGRSRKPQIELARQFGVGNYPAPAGGCLLTDKGFAKRLQDLFAHAPACGEKDLHLLRYGRHLRLNDRAKLIVGRNRSENDNMMALADPGGDTVIKLTRHPGPLGLLPGGADREVTLLAAAICVGYSKAPPHRAVGVQITAAGRREVVRAIGLPPWDIRGKLI